MRRLDSARCAKASNMAAFLGASVHAKTCLISQPLRTRLKGTQAKRIPKQLKAQGFRIEPSKDKGNRSGAMAKIAPLAQ